MAKSARASSRKRNNATLRATIFGPAHDARTKRLSEKLQELISKPKAAEEKVMEVDSTRAEEKEQANTKNANIVDEMDIDAQKTSSKSDQRHHKSKGQRKRAHRKAKNLMVFPSITRKRTGPGVCKAKR